jgi:hypothetical protein
LGLLLLEELHNLRIGDIAHLMVLLDDVAALVAYTSFVIWHERIACVVGLADIAVYPAPTCVALARLLAPHRSVVARGQ